MLTVLGLAADSAVANVVLAGYNTVPINGSRTLTVSLTSGENQNQDFTVLVTNENPARISLSGAVANVLTLDFPPGGTNVQTITVQGVALGAATLAATAGSSAQLTTIPTSGLVGHWLAGQQDLTDTSGYSSAGQHDGFAATGSFSTDPGFTADVPSGFGGYSADLGLNGCMIAITNTSQANDGTSYDNTFDNLPAQQMTVSFWAKLDSSSSLGFFQPYVSKRGEEAAWQIRSAAGQPIAGFTVRGTSGGDDEFDSSTAVADTSWHHFVATRDGVTGERKLYVDGRLSGFIPNDFGSYSLDPDAYLVLGGKWQQQSGAGGTAGNQFYGELYDVRVYAEALNGSQVQNLFLPNTANIVAFADTPVIDAGRSGKVSISIPENANASQSVNVTVTNSSGLVNIAGHAGSVFTVTFPAGAPNTMTLEVDAGATEGVAQLGFGSGSLNSASVSVFVSGEHMIGEWGTNATLADVSGYTNYNTLAGAHDGSPIGSSSINFSSDVPNSKPGQSLDFTSGGGNVALLITNTSMSDADYSPTFDDIISHQLSVSCWIKENTSQNWTAFVSKRGDDDTGFQVRRYGNNNGASFTLRDSSSENGDMGGNITVVNDGNWHNVTAVWDGYAGTRKLYVDGVLDTSISNDFAPFCLAKGSHLIIGGEENRGPGENLGFGNPFTGKIYDLRIYDYPLTAEQVQGLAALGAITVSGYGIHPAGSTNSVSISIPNGANQNSPVTVSVSIADSGVASIAGAVGGVETLTFATGGPTTQAIYVVGAGAGKTILTASATGLAAGTLNLDIYPNAGPRLLGHWLDGAQSFADTSGFAPAGTHDGIVVGSTPTAYAWDADVPPGYSGSSLDLTANGSGGQVAVLITNSDMDDNNYQPTFDNEITNAFTIAFWAKGYTEGIWSPFISKNGESTGWQFRMNPNSANNPSFTIRGTGADDDVWTYDPNVLNDGNWHFYAGTYDAQAGLRTIYIDGQRQLVVTKDTGGVAPTPYNHLMLGAKDDSGLSGWFNGQLFDVRLYNYALSPAQVDALFQPPTALNAAINQTNIPVADTVTMTVTIPNGANSSSPVTVTLTNNAPSVATLVGSVNNVLTLTFPAGAFPAQIVTLVAIAPGPIDITATMGATSVGLASPGVVLAPAMIGHWLSGASNLVDTSGFTPAGTHDGYAVGDNPGSLAFSTNVPPGFSGYSLDLTANGGGANIGVAITNSSTGDARYRSTFDSGISTAFSVAFWEKGQPGWFNPWISKAGENWIGWEARDAYDDYAFTVRGSSGYDSNGRSYVGDDSNWHQLTYVWDGVSGTRQIYVDGVLTLDMTGDYAPMYPAPDEHLALGGRESSPGTWDNAWFNGLLYDVRVYNYPLSASQVATLVAPPTAPALTITAGPNNTAIISWTNTATGYVLQTNSSLTGAWGNSSLTPTMNGGHFTATDTTTNGTTYYRLLKTGN